MRVAIVGATGLVGGTFLKVLEEETKKAHKCSQINKNMIK